MWKVAGILEVYRVVLWVLSGVEVRTEADGEYCEICLIVDVCRE